MRLFRIDDIVFPYGLWVEENNYSTKVSAFSEKTINGSLVIFEQQNIGSQITAKSMSNGWLDKQTLNALVTKSDASLGKSYMAEFEPGGEKAVMFDHTSLAVEFEPLYEGAEFYTGVIRLILL